MATPTPDYYDVYKLRFKLDMPLLPGETESEERYHMALLVETAEKGPMTGRMFHVVGHVYYGMSYESRISKDPSHYLRFHDKELIGRARASTYGDGRSWHDLLDTLPTPPKQFSLHYGKGTYVRLKSLNPRVFYEPDEQPPPLIRCTEWVENEAIPALREAGFLQRCLRSPSP